MIKRPYLFISAGGNTAITGTTCQKMKPSVKNASLTMYLVGKNTTSRKVENNNYAKKVEKLVLAEAIREICTHHSISPRGRGVAPDEEAETREGAIIVRVMRDLLLNTLVQISYLVHQP